MKIKQKAGRYACFFWFLLMVKTFLKKHLTILKKMIRISKDFYKKTLVIFIRILLYDSTAQHSTAQHSTAQHSKRLAKFNTFLSLTFLSLSCLALPSLSAHAESNDSLMKKGMWKDPKTGLVWMRCSIGQKWNGSTCTGKAIKLDWQDANKYFELFNEQVAFGGKRDWRLPTIEELSTIRKCSNGWEKENTVTIGNLTKSTGQIKMDTIPSKNGGSKQVPKWCADGSSEPTIDTRIFPNTPSDFYWSSSPNAHLNGNAWGVYFFSGSDNYNNKNDRNAVRAVRSD